MWNHKTFEIIYMIKDGKLNRVVLNYRKCSVKFFDHKNRLILYRKGLSFSHLKLIEAQIKQITKVVVYARQ